MEILNFTGNYQMCVTAIFATCGPYGCNVIINGRRNDTASNITLYHSFITKDTTHFAFYKKDTKYYFGNLSGKDGVSAFILSTHKVGDAITIDDTFMKLEV